MRDTNHNLYAEILPNSKLKIERKIPDLKKRRSFYADWQSAHSKQRYGFVFEEEKEEKQCKEEARIEKLYHQRPQTPQGWLR